MDTRTAFKKEEDSWKHFCVLLWLDDERDPFSEQYEELVLAKCPMNVTPKPIWVKNFEQFKFFADKYVKYGSFEAVCFDNDLGEEKEGYDCAKYLVEICMDADVDVPPFESQSMNGPANENIMALLTNYHKFYMESHDSNSKESGEDNNSMATQETTGG